MNHFVLLACAMLLLAACESRREVSEQPGMAAESPAPAEESPVGLDESPTALDEPETAQQANDLAPPAEEIGDDAEPAQQTNVGTAARDLAAELQAAVGSPVDCLQDYRPSNTTVVRVDISAIVRSSGLVIEPAASGKGLSANDRQCIERRVGDVVLKPFASPTSETVSTYVELDFRAPVPKETDVGPPVPVLKDVEHPLPKKPTIPRSGTPIDTAPFDRPNGPKGDKPDGPKGDKISGPKPKPIDGYEVEEDSVNWTDD